MTCSDPDTVRVEIYAWDQSNNPASVQPDGTIGGANYGSCETYIVVQDNLFDICSPRAVLNGLIATRENEPVEFVQVNLTGLLTSNVITAADGNYNFENISIGGDYTITPLRGDEPRNGVTTFDLLMLNKHLLRTQPLNNPYQIIAADVNQSSNISALDLIHLRKLLLTIYTEFPASPSWRFIPKDFMFSDPSRPFTQTLPGVINYNNISSGTFKGDFVGVKIGDINGSVAANSGASAPRAPRGVFTLQAAEQELKAGQEYRVSFSAGELTDIQGFQFTLDFDVQALQMTDIAYGLAGEESFGTHLIDEGVITSSWIKNLSGHGDTKAETPLFTLTFRASQDGRLSELLRISSRYTEAEAYNNADEILGVRLAFEDGRSLQDSFHLGQNVPNPWRDFTRIHFYLPEAAEATISIRDLRGRILKVIQGRFEAGDQQATLEEKDLPAIGVLYYTLETKG